ncbi:MAG: hypothetical protein R3F55_21095 [Alphaproteobacteria bacterium]
MADGARKGLGARRLAAIAVAFVGIVVVLVIALGPGGFGGLFGGVSPAERADQVLAGIKAEAPYVATLERSRPDVYAALRDGLIRDAEADTPVMLMANNGRRVLAAWLQQAIATAPDAVALELLAMTTDQLRELQQSNPQLCAAMVSGQPIEDVDAFVSDAMRTRERTAYEALAAAPADAAVVTLPAAEVDAAYQAIAPDLAERFGADFDRFRGTDPTTLDPARFCEIQIALLDGVAAMGPQRAAALARSILGGGGDE